MGGGKDKANGVMRLNSRTRLTSLLKNVWSLSELTPGFRHSAEGRACWRCCVLAGTYGWLPQQGSCHLLLVLLVPAPEVELQLVFGNDLKYN